MRHVQLRRPRCGSDFVLPDVPMLDSPEWSDEDIAPFFSRVSPASRQPAHPHHRHAHAGAMAMHPGYHRGSPRMMVPLAPTQYGSPFRVQNVAAPFAAFNHPGRGDATRGGYASPPPPFGDRARQPANAARRSGNTAHHRGRSNFQRGAESDGGDEDADDEHDEAGTRAEASHGAGVTALLDRVAEEDTGAGGGDGVPVSHYGGSFGAGRVQSRFQFQRGSLFAPSAQQFMNGMGQYGDARDAGSDESDNADVSSSTTSGSNSSGSPSGTLPPNRRASMAQYFQGPATGGAWLDEGPALAPLPRRPSARGTSVASAFLNERRHQHPSIFISNAGGRGGAATIGTASAAPSIFRNFFDGDDEDDDNSFGCGLGGAAAVSNLSTYRSRTTGGAAPSMMVISAAHNGAAAGAAAGRYARGNAAPATAAAAATRLPEVSAQGHYSYMHSNTAPTNPAVSSTAPATITDSNSADPTNPTIGADPKLGALFGNHRQGSFLMAMDEVPADVRAQHAATTHLPPHDANTHGRRDSQPRPTQPGERSSPPQLSHGFQADRWTGAKRGGLGAALAEYALLSKRVAGELRAASATSTRSAHSSRTAEGPPSHHQTPDDAPDSDEDAAVLERRSRFFEVSTSRRHGARDEEGGQQHNGVYPGTLFACGASGLGGGQHKTQSPAAPPSIKGQPDRVNFRNRIAPRGQSAGGGGVGGSSGSVAGAQGLPPRRPATMTDSTAFSVEMHPATGTVTAMSSAASTPHDAVMTAPVTEVDEYGLLAWAAGSPMRTRFGSTVSYGGFSDLAGGNTPAAPPALPGAPAAARGAGVARLSLQPLSMATAGGGRFSRRTSSNASPHTVFTILDDASSPLAALPSTRRISPSGAARPRPHDGGQRTLPPPQLTASTLQSTAVALPASASTALPATGVTSAQTTPAAPAVATATESPATSAPSPMTPSPRIQHTLSLYHQDEYYPINSFRGNSVDRLTSGAASPYWVSNASAAATGATARMAAPAARRSHEDELDPLAQPRQSLSAPSPDRLRVAEDDQRRLSRSNPTPGASPASQRAPSSVRVTAMSPVVFVSTAGAAGPQDVPFASTPKAGGGSTILAMDGEYQFFTRDTEMSSSGVGEGCMMAADTHAIVSTRAVTPKLSTANARASPRSAVPGEVEQRAPAQTSASGDHFTAIVSAVEVELPQKPRKGAQHERRRGSPRERGLPLRPATPPKAQPAPRPWDSCSGLTPTTSGAGLSGPESAPQNARTMEHVAVASTAAHQRSPRASSRPSRRLKVFAKRMAM